MESPTVFDRGAVGLEKIAVQMWHLGMVAGLCIGLEVVLWLILQQGVSASLCLERIAYIPGLILLAGGMSLVPLIGGIWLGKKPGTREDLIGAAILTAAGGLETFGA